MKVNDFRHISLVMVHIILFSKLLANRRKEYLLRLPPTCKVPLLQTETYMITFSLVMKFFYLSSEKEKVWLYGLKLDVEKVYDRLEWDFSKSDFKMLASLTNG